MQFISVTELIPESYLERLDLAKTFSRDAPLHLDLGCGDGSFLFALAQRTPEKNFLGIERLAGRVASACRKAAKIDNLRIMRVEISYAVRYLLPPESVETFYLLFPDPWPKRRHHPRRTVTDDLLHAINDALIENGVLRIATDQLDYFEQMMKIARADSSFAMVDPTDADLPRTKFETKFRTQGAPIHRLELRKISPVT